MGDEMKAASGLSTEKDYTGPHPICWTGTDFEHRCQRPSGRRCIDCGEPAGTLWGPIWCPACDVIRLGNVSRQMESLLTTPPEQPPAQPLAPTTPTGAAGGERGGL